MTALKPLEHRIVRAVASERYPLNKVCAHPECDQTAVDPHHTFPRSQIAGDSWFVVLASREGETMYAGKYEPFPHVTGLCRAHHNDVEEHRAWIKLEDSQFNWYDRKCELDNLPTMDGTWEIEQFDNTLNDWDATSYWIPLGPLNPQPGSVEGKPKRRKKPSQPARKKAVYSIRVPKDESENGYEVLDTLVDGVREKLAPELGHTDSVPAYYVIVGALAQVLQS